MSYDLIAFDLDGTLLDSHKEVLPDSIEMIKKAVAAGKSVCISTGCSVVEASLYKKELQDVQYWITNSGATIWDNFAQNYIFSVSIDKETELELFDRQSRLDSNTHLVSDKSYLSANIKNRLAEFHLDQYTQRFALTAIYTENLRKFYIDNYPMPVYKHNIYLLKEEWRDEFAASLQDLPIKIAYSEYASVECSPKGISKGSALMELTNRLNIPIERTIAVGDSDNDKVILETAGLGIAMGNALDRIKAIADVVVKDNDHGGCAQAIEEYLLRT